MGVKIVTINSLTFINLHEEDSTHLERILIFDDSWIGKNIKIHHQNFIGLNVEGEVLSYERINELSFVLQNYYHNRYKLLGK